MKHFTYHLYHHQPEPLPLEEVNDQAWLCNNALTYSLVARIAAPNEAEALQSAQDRARRRPVARRVQIQAGNLLRETLPGDVLVAEYAAWMVTTAGELRRVAYPASTPWKRLRQFSDQAAKVDCLAWSPDGQVIAATASDRRVVLHLLAGDQPSRRSYEHGNGYSIRALAWSPQGQRLAAAHANGEIHLFYPAPTHPDGSIGSILICRTEEALAWYGRATPRCVTWSPDGVQVLAGREDGSVVGWDARTGACLPTRKFHQKAITALVFSPRSEQRLLTAGEDGAMCLWEGSTKSTECVHPRAVTAAVWSPDGQLIASCVRTEPVIYLWQAQTGVLLARLPLSISSTELLEIRALAWSPQGDYLAAGCDDSTVQLVEVARRQHRFTYRLDQHTRVPVPVVAWSPDGRMLAASDGSVGIAVWSVRQDLRAREDLQPASWGNFTCSPRP